MIIYALILLPGSGWPSRQVTDAYKVQPADSADFSPAAIYENPKNR